MTSNGMKRRRRERRNRHFLTARRKKVRSAGESESKPTTSCLVFFRQKRTGTSGELGRGWSLGRGEGWRGWREEQIFTVRMEVST